MFTVLNGIYALYDAGGDFKTALTGALHFELAGNDTNFPYAIYSMITGNPEYTFDQVQEYAIIQFDLYAEDDDTRMDLYTKLTALYDDARPTATGYTSIIMERISYRFLREGEQNEIYRAIVEYRVLIEKSK